jgi:hypothetical protein
VIKILIAFVAGFLIATLGVAGIVNYIDSKVEEIQETINDRKVI